MKVIKYDAWLRDVKLKKIIWGVLSEINPDNTKILTKIENKYQ